MSKKVFYTCYQPYLIDVAMRFHKEQNWQPVYWYTMPDVEARIKSAFPDVLTHNYNDAIKGVVPEHCGHIPMQALDETILREFAYDEFIALNIMERNDMSGTFTYAERIENFHFQLSYWWGVLNMLKPDILFMEALPHEPNDYVLYRLAQKKGIQIISYSLSLFPGRIFPMQSYEEGAPIIRERLTEKLAHWDGKPVQLIPQLEEHINKIRGEYEKNLRFDVAEGVNFFKNTYKKNNPGQWLLAKLMLLIKLFNLAKFKKRFTYILSLTQPTEHIYQKQKGRSYKESQMTNYEFNQLVSQGSKLKKVLLKYYEQIENKTPDLNVPFIYCPLHYQPEATTSPLGGYFVDQQMMLKLISENLPAGWKIYVKDHFAQFLPSLWGETYRTKKYYDDLKAIPNVVILPVKFDSYTLIDKCKAVATVTGTASFEAPVRGKAAMCFGHNLIFFPCEGTFYTPDQQSVSKVMQMIVSGYKPDLNKVKLYLETVYENTYKGGIGTPFNTEYLGVTRSDNVEAHYQAALDLLAFLDKKNSIQQKQ